MKAHRFADLEGFLAAVRELGGNRASWRPAYTDRAWSTKAFDLVAEQNSCTLMAIRVETNCGDTIELVEYPSSRTDRARLALELYGAGAPFADVRCEVPIGWRDTCRGTVEIYEGDFAEATGLYSTFEVDRMRRALELATYSRLGLPEGEIRAWQERQRGKP